MIARRMGWLKKLADLVLDWCHGFRLELWFPIGEFPLPKGLYHRILQAAHDHLPVGHVPEQPLQ